MTKRTAPKTLDAAVERLTDIGELATAVEWERAAIVYAFTTKPGQGTRSDLARTSQVSPNEFAKLGIVGLKSKDTVAKYHDIWADAIENHRAKNVKPGDSFTIPKVEWPGTGRGKHEAERFVGSTKPEHAKQVAERFVEEMPPETKAAIRDELAADPDLPAPPMDPGEAASKAAQARRRDEELADRFGSELKASVELKKARLRVRLAIDALQLHNLRDNPAAAEELAEEVAALRADLDMFEALYLGTMDWDAAAEALLEGGA